MDIPILTDTEPETSMEHDGLDKIAKRLSTAVHNSTKSLFNITFENLDEQKHESVEFKDHEQRLLHEIKDWQSLLKEAYRDLKQSKEKHPTIDKSILPTEKLNYLKSAPDLQNFIRESIEFRRQAHIFLELDYAEYMEMVENLEGLCEHRLDLLKYNKLEENLADCGNKKKTGSEQK